MACRVNPFTGTYGFVAVYTGGIYRRIARITFWSLDVVGDGFRFVSTDVGGWTQFIPSVRSATGSFDFKVDAQHYQHRTVSVGHVVRLLLVASDHLVDPNIDFQPIWRINEAVITRYSVAVDVDRAEIVSGTMDFEANGAVDFPGDFTPILPAVGVF